MKKKVKGRLRDLFPKAHLSKKRIDEISARLASTLEEDAEEEDIDVSINSANDIYPFAEIAKQDDRVASYQEKISKLKKVKPKDDDDDDDNDGDDDNDDDDDKDIPAWAKALTNSLSGLSEKMTAMEQGKVVDQKKNGAKSLFSKSKTFKDAKESVKEHFFSQINVESETPIEDQIEEQESLYEEIVQFNIDKGDYAGGPPNGRPPKNKVSEEDIKTLADDIL